MVSPRFMLFTVVRGPAGRSKRGCMPWRCQAALQVDVRSSWVGAEGEGDILRNFTDVSRDRQADVVYVVVADCCAVAVAEKVYTSERRVEREASHFNSCDGDRYHVVVKSKS